VQRTQLSTSATQLTCNFDAVCQDWVKSSTLYLENNGLRSLLYSSSSRELNLVNTQLVKVSYSETVDTVVGGDHVVSAGLPQAAGSNCRIKKERIFQNCKSVDLCVKISFSGCSVNPQASLTFGDGSVTDLALVGSVDADRFGQSICQAGATLVDSIVLEPGVECGTNPTCGTGCTSVMDSDKDTLIIKHRWMASDIMHCAGAIIFHIMDFMLFRELTFLKMDLVCSGIH